MKGFFAKLKDFSPKLKVSEILLSSKPQNRWKKKPALERCNKVTDAGKILWWKVAWFSLKLSLRILLSSVSKKKKDLSREERGNLIDRRPRGHRPLPPVHQRQVCTTVYRGEDSTGRRPWVRSDREFHTICTTGGGGEYSHIPKWKYFSYYLHILWRLCSFIRIPTFENVPRCLLCFLI